MKTDVLRDKFLEFFKSKKHKIVESDSLVPADDLTVLFTPAGMNQFKKEFLGFIGDFSRAASSQRCLRTDDLDKVGRTEYHHTFFEMLGNFSFGDYFKDEAILWAWEFLNKELGIDKDKLSVSVYKDDDETYKIWKDKIKVPLKKIIKLGDKENFWPSEARQLGPNGPCGPCSEIFFDRGEEIGCKKKDCNPSCDCGRFIEVWNLVFTQFNRKDAGALEPLPKKNIDTGMGLERLAAVMQGVASNFEIDIFSPIVKEIYSNVKRSPKEEFMYAVADHIRAIVFAIYDGVLPSNEGRGYVIRKLIRKSVLHLMSLGIEKPFLYKLVPIVCRMMKNPYPGLEARRENISEIILSEEDSFISTLESSDALIKQGLSKLAVITERPLKYDPEQVGLLAFKLYDTYGIPLKLTKDWLKIHGVGFSQEAFDRELENQKNRSKSQSGMKGDVFDVKGLHLGIKETKFLGYKDKEVKAKVIKIVKDNQQIKKINKGDEASIILDKTVFYPESGGQVADTGELIKGKIIFEVLDTKKINKIIIHKGRFKSQAFKKGDLVLVKTDSQRRLSIARNHTATHLLQAALRKVLGEHVKQQGSLVAEDRLRFDFTHFKDITDSQLSRIEELVNSYIMANYEVKKKEMRLTEARKKGALAFFGDKYEDTVRVVSIPGVSSEVCGGTHLDQTGTIGLFKIVHEGSIASGVRRIEAQTGSFAYKTIKKEEDALNSISSFLNTQQDYILEELSKKQAYTKDLEKKLEGQKFDALKNSIDPLIKNAEIINGISVITCFRKDIDVNSLRRTVDLIKEKIDPAVIALGNETNLVIGVTKSICEKGIDASKLIKEIAILVGGNGGGRPDFSQAGVSIPSNFPAAFLKLKTLIRNQK
ncbi:MAG: alanine--tRNA ligase [Candidatus Omnitrophota bacterium]